VRPLRSLVRESFVSATTSLAGGAAFLVVATAASPSSHTVVQFLAISASWCVFFGAFVYFAVVRRAVRHHGEPSTVERELPSTTLWRRSLEDVAWLGLLGLVALGFGDASLGALALGNGVLLGLAGYRWRSWERRNRARLLRGPRFGRRGADQYYAEASS
jgi:hypothetical protein